MQFVNLLTANSQNTVKKRKEIKFLGGGGGSKEANKQN